MKDYKYKYIDPTERGMIKFKVSRKQFKELIPNRTYSIFNKVDFYYSENYIDMHTFTNWIGKTLAVLLFPFYVLIHGLGQFKTLIKEYKDLFNQKESGSFASDRINKFTFNGEEVIKRYVKLEEIYKSQIKGDN